MGGEGTPLGSEEDCPRVIPNAKKCKRPVHDGKRKRPVFFRELKPFCTVFLRAMTRLRALTRCACVDIPYSSPAIPSFALSRILRPSLTLSLV